MSTDLHTAGAAAELVGRELDLVALQGRLQDPATRLITLTGTGGVGKSRLAAEAARRTAGLFPGGIHPLDLPACADVETALKDIDRIVAEAAGRPRTLLLLDGVEHIAHHLAPALSCHLAATGRLTVLATGQEVLRLYGERVVPVAPLPTPGALPAPDVADVQDNPAVRLFTCRAHEANPAFALTAENVEAVVDICNLLEGVPLVLELAARRLRLYPPQELRAWLLRGGDSHLPGPVDVPPRQRSTPAIAAWSCRGLDQGQRALLARLALFHHGLTLATAEKISPLDAGETAVALEALLDRNLLTLEENPHTDSRLTMSRTIRAFGLALLEQAGPARAAAARQAHARYYQRLLHTLEGRFQGSEQQRWLRAAAAEHANVLAALHHLTDAHQRRPARTTDRERSTALLERAALVSACLYPWLIRGELTEGLRWFDSTERALQGEDGEESEERLRARARLCTGAGMLAAALGDHDGAAHRHRRAADIYQRLREPGPGALASARRGHALFRCGERAAGQSLLTSARTTLNVQGDTAGSAEAAAHLAELLLAGGEGEQARALLERAERIQRRHGAVRDLARTLSLTARRHLHAGDESAARAALRESIGLYGSIDERTELPAVLDTFALLLVRTAGQPQRATRLLAAAEALRARTGARLEDADRDRLRAAAAELRRQLGRTVFATAWAEGLRLRPEAMAAEALAMAEPGRAEDHGEAGALTPRQLQVALLVADGLTNRRIAHQLDIAEWTVVNHVRHVMRKLGCNSRVQVAWAVGRRQ